MDVNLNWINITLKTLKEPHRLINSSQMTKAVSPRMTLIKAWASGLTVLGLIPWGCSQTRCWTRNVLRIKLGPITNQPPGSFKRSQTRGSCCPKVQKVDLPKVKVTLIETLSHHNTHTRHSPNLFLIFSKICCQETKTHSKGARKMRTLRIQKVPIKTWSTMLIPNNTKARGQRSHTVQRRCFTRSIIRWLAKLTQVYIIKGHISEAHRKVQGKQRYYEGIWTDV